MTTASTVPRLITTTINIQETTAIEAMNVETKINTTTSISETTIVTTKSLEFPETTVAITKENFLTTPEMIQTTMTAAIKPTLSNPTLKPTFVDDVSVNLDIVEDFVKMILKQPRLLNPQNYQHK